MNASIGYLTRILMAVVLWCVTATLVQAAPLPGAIFTTDSTCSGVNLNIYSNKSDVYLNGGPSHPGAAGLPDGFYYVQVTNPSGSLVLGKSVTASVQVINGEFAFPTCRQLTATVFTTSSGYLNPGYDDTDNPGGVYKVWVSTVPTFDNDSTKTDNFKVDEDVTIPPQNLPNIIVEKFYDANVNGVFDDGEALIDGWKVSVTDGFTDILFTPVDVVVAPGIYAVMEFTPVEPNWVHTTPQLVENIALAENETAIIQFGNVCVGAGGGKTLGFWSNKNGQAKMNDGGTMAPELALLVGYNLRTAGGGNFDPGNYTAFRNWLLSANATNMAYMLSAQMAAMVLNVEAGFVSGGSMVFAPQLLPYPGTGVNALGFISITDLLNAANTELGLHGLVLAQDPNRAYQEALKDALDDANNNETFVQASPCPFSFAE